MNILKEINESTDFLSGQLVLVDKPVDWTSFDVVAKIRGALRRRLGIKKIKVGHSGTLDPLATGLVLIGIGKGTKWLHELQGLDKTYTGSLKIGAVTATYDAEMPEEEICSCQHISIKDIHSASENFIGQIEQTPPIYSAVKIDGQPAYKAARAGKSLELKSRSIQIGVFDIAEIEHPNFSFKVNCSKGTYIRSLVHDLGQDLKVGAYLTSLRRTEVGEYKLEDAWSLDALIQAIEDDPKK